MSLTPSNQQVGAQADIVITAEVQYREAKLKQNDIVSRFKKSVTSVQNQLRTLKLAHSTAINKLNKDLETLNSRKEALISSAKNRKVSGLSNAERGQLKSINNAIANNKLRATKLSNEYGEKKLYLEKKLFSSQKALNMASQKSNKIVNSARANLEKEQTTLKQLNNDVKKTTVRFDGAAMSLMFFGMAIQRVGKMLWQVGSKSFREINESVEGSVNGFMLLEGATKYLGFTIGQALEPVALWLVKIVDKISDWVSLHPGMTKFITLFTIIAGSLMMFGGMLTLGINGLIEMGLRFGIVKTNAEGAIKSIAGINKASIRNGWKNVKNLAVKVGDYLGGELKNSIKWIRAHPIKAVMGGLVLTGIIMAFAWLNRLQKNMGGWDELLKNAARGYMDYFATIVAGIQAVIVKAKDMWLHITGRGNEASTLSFTEAYNQAYLQDIDKIKEDFGEPAKGFINDSRTLAEIWEGDIYPEVEEVKESMNGIKDTLDSINNVTFSDNAIMGLYSKGLLDQDSVGALLYADKANPNTISDTSESVLKNLLKSQGTTSEYVIHNLNISSDADNINTILESLKSFV